MSSNSLESLDCLTLYCQHWDLSHTQLFETLCTYTHLGSANGDPWNAPMVMKRWACEVFWALKGANCHIRVWCFTPCDAHIPKLCLSNSLIHWTNQLDFLYLLTVLSLFCDVGTELCHLMIIYKACRISNKRAKSCNSGDLDYDYNYTTFQ